MGNGSVVGVKRGPYKKRKETQAVVSTAPGTITAEISLPPVKRPYKQRVFSVVVTQDNYKIEKGIPISGKDCLIGNQMPFGKMKVGDSFYTSLKPGNLASKNYQWRNKNKSPFLFTVRKEKKGSRVWRIK